jgi:hypothetical protein
MFIHRNITNFWRNELPEADLPFGVFGENLTTEGLLEENVNVGDPIRNWKGGIHRHAAAPACFQTRHFVSVAWV